MMQDKTGELHARTHRSVGGHVVGDELVARAAASVDQLAQALSNLARASDYTHGVDVTVEVPDPEPGHGR